LVSGAAVLLRTAQQGPRPESCQLEHSSEAQGPSCCCAAASLPARQAALEQLWLLVPLFGLGYACGITTWGGGPSGPSSTGCFWQHNSTVHITGAHASGRVLVCVTTICNSVPSSCCCLLFVVGWVCCLARRFLPCRNLRHSGPEFQQLLCMENGLLQQPPNSTIVFLPSLGIAWRMGSYITST
jgi:hypothetical protein